ncbi:SubName: Full=Related to ERG26-C-3 sterol dehydrogenase (C-4 decarboxylase) {ECO:0000313/EMBL:CCA74852.1} [Serendipita indica DSM 11827]|nr:SubName: Full=Related to ERG26-C-3 sterol dehydrogenase (C-4 decarboxylase) {ECO:0000313/EMBL:CCA74852.1} [Serendipita indica DSM 11827]
MPANQATQRESYLVIGGCGFLGRHIVEALLNRGEQAVAVFDLVQRHHDKNVQFFTGDLCEAADLAKAIKGAVIAAAQEHGVKTLVYTSSAGVTYTGGNCIDVDERLPVVDATNAYDTYNLTKAEAEKLVLAANGQGGLKTVALRPSGIFGPGDRQNFEGLANVIRRGQTKWQIGYNDNLWDWTYVGNVVKAHLLAADKLVTEAGPKPREELCDYALPTISLTTHEHRVPTSAARPLGPAIAPVPNGPAIEAAFNDPDAKDDVRAVWRTRYDPLTEQNIERELEYPLQAAGQAFYITNGEPIMFWDYVHAVWKEMGHVPTSRIVIPATVGLWLATAAEWWAWLTGKTPGFTRERVGYSVSHRWFNIEKARRVLGYEPDVGIQDGIKISAKWYLESKGVNAITPE